MHLDHLHNDKGMTTQSVQSSTQSLILHSANQRCTVPQLAARLTRWRGTYTWTLGKIIYTAHPPHMTLTTTSCLITSHYAVLRKKHIAFKSSQNSTLSFRQSLHHSRETECCWKKMIVVTQIHGHGKMRPLENGLWLSCKWDVTLHYAAY